MMSLRGKRLFNRPTAGSACPPLPRNTRTRTCAETLTCTAVSRARSHGCGEQGKDARAALNAYDSILQAATWPLDGVAAAAACGKALLLESGGGPTSSDVEVDMPGAVQLYRQAAEAGNATAQFAMATLHALGMHGVPFDEARAIVLLRQAAIGGDAAAQLAMGYRY